MFLFSAPEHSLLTPTLEIVEASWVSLSHLSNELEDIRDQVWFSSVYQRVRQAVQRD